MRILITGAGGQLGRALVRRAAGHTVLAFRHDQLDVAGPDTAQRIAEAAPDVVVNAAAMTDVDGCERDPDAAYRANALGARNAALGAARAGGAFVQVSTDYVFDGLKGAAYWEFDAPSPVSVYGASKLAGEALARDVHPATYVVRSAWLFGLGGRSFVTRILELAAERDALAVVDHEVGSPTFCDDLADAILALVATGAFGTYHLAAEGACSRFEFARAILARAGRADVALSVLDRYDRPASPPSYAPLRNFAAAELGIRLPAWQSGLQRFFAAGGGDGGPV